MQKDNLKNLKKELEELRKSPHGISPKTLIRLAKKLGRSRFTRRGKEPTYINGISDRPLSIPGHGKDLKPGTARSIIDILLSDIDELELRRYENEEKDENEKS